MVGTIVAKSPLRPTVNAMHCRYSQPTLVNNPAEIVEINGFALNRESC